LKSALLIVALILLIRLPFLNQAVQGDDVYYIASAEHAQIDPLHPNHTHYLFQGRTVDFRGHPHPPLDAWCLAALIAIFGEIREVPFHAAYIVFSLIAALSMYSLARRFSPHPLWATLLFIAVPAFVINGNSFESDIPFLAFWMAGIAAFIHGHDRDNKKLLTLSAACLALASLAAPQAVFAIPILAIYARRRWLVLAAPLVAIAAWQTFEFLTSGQFPFAIAAGYQQSYGLQRIAAKLRNATSLSIHLLYLLAPLPLLSTCGALQPIPPRDTRFLTAWIAIFFLGAVAVFPAGSARYLLPLAAPIAILVSRLPQPILGTLFTLQLTLSLLLATVNYQHWDAYRQFARSLSTEAQHRRVWVNADWGLRYYLELEGALPVRENQPLPPGDLLVSSELALPVPYNHGGSTLVPIATREIRPAIPLRLIGLETRSAYSSDDKGFFPFGISRGLIDRVHADILKERVPTRDNILMNAPDADDQILTGIYPRDNQQWRWMAKQSSIVLKTPSTPTPIHVALYIPDTVPARTVTISLDNKPILTRTFPAPGLYTIVTAPQHPVTPTTVLTIDVDKTISTPADIRELGIILTEAGFGK
jgi:hypothetical protein